MSMINDALRRASAGNFTGPPPLPAMPAPGALPPLLDQSAVVPPPMLPEAAPELLPPPLSANKNSLPILLLIVFLFSAAGAAAVYIWERSHHPATREQPAS